MDETVQFPAFDVPAQTALLNHFRYITPTQTVLGAVVLMEVDEESPGLGFGATPPPRVPNR